MNHTTTEIACMQLRCVDFPLCRGVAPWAEGKRPNPKHQGPDLGSRVGLDCIEEENQKHDIR